MGEKGRRAILIVEDSETCSDTLEIALASVDGVDVWSVATAEAALEFLAAHDTVAMVTDLNLPGMTGFELLERLAPPSRMPVVVVTSGDPDPLAPVRAIGLGASAYFSKPYSPAEVRRTLEVLIHEA